MTENGIQSAFDVFDQVIERTGAERDRELDRLCGANEALRKEVLSLLEAHDTAGAGFLNAPALSGAMQQFDGVGSMAEAASLAGERVGAYRLLREIGRGGMGRVWLAERADGEFEQTVAIKLIRAGIAGEEVLRRFRRERQVLARLKHPSIASLFDGGTIELPGGMRQPYLAMEYVEGLPIDQFCDQRRLPIRRRIALFREVCAAVQHAHQNLVIHRDLKPGNVFITSGGAVKLLDFGIARVLRGNEATRDVTMTIDRRLTPAYASPEQVRGGVITTASDVYSLGVILYQLLTGARPYDLAGTSSPREIDEIICEASPHRPSTMIDAGGADEGTRTTSALRSTEPAQLKRELRGDLENILLMALRKEPERRYASASDLSEDLRRHLAHETVSAHADSLLYRSRKFIARNRVLVGAAAVIAVLLVAGLLTTGTLYIQTERARQDEQRERILAEATSGFLESLLESVDPDIARSRDTTLLREVLHDASGRIDTELGRWPEVSASMHRVIGSTYNAIAEYERARGHLNDAVALARRMGDRGHLVEALSARAALLINASQYVKAEADAREALDYCAEGAQNAARRGNLLNLLALALQGQGRYDESTRFYRDAIVTLRTVNDRPLLLANALNEFGVLLANRTLHDDAIAALREALAIRHEHLEPDAPGLANSNLGLAWALRRADRLNESEEHYRLALGIDRASLPPDHPDLATAMNQLAGCLEEQGEVTEAGQLYLEALRIFRSNYGEGHVDVGVVLNNLGRLYDRTERFAQAEDAFSQALEAYRESLGDDHLFIAILLENMLHCREGQQRLLESGDLLVECRRIQRLHWDDESPRVITVRSLEGALLAERGDLAQAEAMLLAAHESIVSHGEDDTRRADIIRRLVRLYELWQRPDDAATWQDRLDELSGDALS